MGKGDKRRPVDEGKFRDAWSNIFTGGNKDEKQSLYNKRDRNPKGRDDSRDSRESETTKDKD